MIIGIPELRRRCLSGWGFLLVALLLRTVSGEPVLTDPLPAAGTVLPAGRLTVGAQFADQRTGGLNDLLIPLVAARQGLLFLDARGQWNDDASSECNIGLGERLLFPGKNMIAGANAFLDTRDTALGNRISRMGLGVEFLSTWVDLRANAYLPIGGEQPMDQFTVSSVTRQDSREVWADPTGEGHAITQLGYRDTDVYRIDTHQHFQRFEQGMEGFDAEIGTLLPLPELREWMDIKLFAGLYDFNGRYGEDLRGPKARLEITPLPALTLEGAWHEDREVEGSRLTFGFRASLPFDLGRLSHGRNPFAGAAAGFTRSAGSLPFASRLTDMVVRDLHLRSEVSPWQEVLADRHDEIIRIAHGHQEFHDVLYPDVTFVDHDRAGVIPDGTWENPFSRIGDGVLHAVGELIYVCHASQPYHEAVTLQTGQILWGSGSAIAGKGSRVMGGTYPILSSDGSGPAITLGDHSTVRGVAVIQDPGAAPQPGIQGHGATGIILEDNILAGAGLMPVGINLEMMPVTAYSAIMINNRISDMAGEGIKISGTVLGSLDVRLSGNSCTLNGSHGVAMGLDTVGGDAVLDITGQQSSGNGGQGVHVELNAFTGQIAMALDRCSFENNQLAGVYSSLWAVNGVSVVLSGTRMTGNHDSGAILELFSPARVAATFSGNESSGNNLQGVAITTDSGLGVALAGRGNDIERNGTTGLGLTCLSPVGSYEFGTAANPGLNGFLGNGGAGVALSGAGILSACGNWWGTPFPVAGVDYTGPVDASLPLPAAP